MRELIDTWIGLNDLAHTIGFLTLVPAGGGESVASQHGVEPLVERAAGLGIDADEFGTAVNRYIEAARAGDYSDNAPQQLIKARRQAVEAALAELGPSIEKTEAFLQALADAGELTGTELEAYADPSVRLANAQRRDLAAEWRSEWLDGRDQRLAVRETEVFWVSLDFQDHYDDAAYYRVWERLGFGEFDMLFADVERHVGERLVDGLASGDPFGRYPSIAGYYATALAEQVWLVARSHRLRVRVHVPAEAAVASLFFAQQADGWWPAPVAAEGGAHPPSVLATAMATIAARRISFDEEHERQAKLAIDWLIGAQDADGFWVDYKGDADVVSTGLALEAIAGARRDGTELVSERAAQWLLAQQHPQGTWTGYMPAILVTVTVLSALRKAATGSEQVPPDLAGALTLLRRSELLATERSVGSRQLAVVGAYTALEAVLYALLGHPSINETTVRDNGQVIGFDEAWVKYEAALVGTGKLEEGKHVNGYGALRSLTHVRDGVVHRATQPSEGDTARIVGAAVVFAAEQIEAVFGFDPTSD